MISQRRPGDEADFAPPVEQPLLPIRILFWLDRRLRPYLGWAVLFAALLLTTLPASALSENDWLDLGELHTRLLLVGPLALLLVWLLLGWRRPRAADRHRLWRWIGGLTLLVLVGALVISQSLVGWLPGPISLLRTTVSNEWATLGRTMLADLARLTSRYALWWEGVQVGGATQDDLVFAGIAATVFWVVGVLTGWLVRRYRQGLLASIPAVWLLGTMLLYSTTNRGIMLLALLLAVALHLLLDHDRMVRKWQDQQYDYNPGLATDRLLLVSAIGLFIFVLAAVTPSVSIRAITTRYYALVDPLNSGLEGIAERLFPDISGTSRRPSGGGVLSGLPNEFLLSSGPNLSDAVVMRYRTNEALAFDMGAYEEAPPPGHYMRGLTLTVYDGKGWQNAPGVQRQNHAADQSWTEPPQRGRKLLTQSVFLDFNTQLLYAAPEPLEPSAAYRTESRSDGDLIAMWARERSYNVVSSIPAVNDEMLDGVGSWGDEQPLPPDYAIHLDLPPTVTDRTRTLAADLTGGLETQFQKAQAIESFLRGYEYDLSVPEPPAEVEDVADYFLFDLQRGYCDYYATAFIVLARLAGLPARFATGFAVGRWDAAAGLWVVTEAEAHSWPEVYFPEYGWIPFEPTAGRSELTRIGIPEFNPSAATLRPEPPPTVEEGGVAWNWQMLLWLAPLGLLIWGGYRLVVNQRLQREDPWLGLLRWGQKVGRPMDAGETVLEYGHGLARFVTAHQTQEQDTGRYIAREVSALSDDVSLAHYASAEQRQAASGRAVERWQRLRSYLRRARIR